MFLSDEVEGDQQCAGPAAGFPSLIDQYRLKVDLLCHGCDVSDDFVLPREIAEKQIHLYAHSTNQPKFEIPEDVLLPSVAGPLIARIRYNPDAPFQLQPTTQGYSIFDRHKNQYVPVDLARAAGFANNLEVAKVCALLGEDVIGVTPYNYCFYFKDGDECRFCEILPTFKELVKHKSAVKQNEAIANSVRQALALDNGIRHLAITSGNYVSYDETVRKFADLLKPLQATDSVPKGDVLGTLMPPDDLSLLQLLAKTGYTKVYFSLEVFRKDLFAVMCPGKDKFGYGAMKDALRAAIAVFGPGNVYTNFVYGIQSLDMQLSGSSYDPNVENEICMQAVEELLAMGAMPVFTLYHYGGHNKIGNIALVSDSVAHFFEYWGRKVNGSGLVPAQRDAALFSSRSLSNTVFNDGLLLARQGLGKRETS